MNLVLALTLLGACLLIGILATAHMPPYYAGTPFCPSPRKFLPAMMDLSDVKPGERVYDLGCGDGRVVFAFADKGADAVGIDMDWTLYWRARLIKRIFGRKGQIIHGDFFQSDLRDADVIFCFLSPGPMARLALSLPKQLRKGCRIVSLRFELPGRKPDAVRHCSWLRSPATLYLYRV